MLVASCYSNNREFEAPPRVISEVRKSRPGSDLLELRPKLTGDLLVKLGTERKWWPRRAVVRNGQLQLSSGGHFEGAPGPLRLPLRQLSLQAGALPNSLSLCKGPNIVLTLQTANEQAFDVWVKTIAIELIRQTPLDDVKYLDIFTLASCWKSKSTPSEFKDCNSNYLPSGGEESPKAASDSNNNEEKTVEVLLKKCQNAESYVPVKEKLILFESLCKLGRKVRSTEDVSCKGTPVGAKRARSMHDLSNIQSSKVVREICKYFEIKNEAININTINKYGTITRFNHSDSQLNSVKRNF